MSRQQLIKIKGGKIADFVSEGREVKHIQTHLISTSLSLLKSGDYHLSLLAGATAP